MSKIRILDDLLPVYRVENNCILSRKGDVTVAFEITLPEIFTLSTDDFESLHQSWLKAIRILPTNCTMHKQDWFVEAAFAGNFNKEHTFLSRSSERFFNERPYLDHRCYLMLTKTPEGRKPSSSMFSNLIRPTLVPSQSIDVKLMESFMDKAGQFAKILENSGFIRCKRLGNEELASTENIPGLIERYCYLLNAGEQPIIRDIDLSNDLKIGDLHCQLFTLADVEDLPAMCGPRINYDKYSTDKTKFSVAFASAIGQILPCNHIYNQFIIIEDPQTTIKNLESRRLRLQSLSAYSRENSISHESVNEFLNEAISQQRLPVKAHFNLLTWSDQKDRLKDIKNSVSAALAQMDARVKQETVSAPQLFWSSLPGNEADFPINEAFDTLAEQATCFLNMETNYLSSISPVGIRLGDRLTGRPVNVDISDMPMREGLINNRNKFLLGPSGSGKSFFVNAFLRTYVEQGSHCVVVDVGHSYRGLCELLNGYYFTYSVEQPIKFNPFFLEEAELDVEKRESIKTMLLALWKKDNESFTRSEYITLSNALQAYYGHLKNNPEIFPCFNTFYEFLKSDFLTSLRSEGIKEKDFDIDNFVYVLRPYYKGGEYDYLLNANENLNLLSQPFVVFELDAITNNPILFSTVTIIIMQCFIDKMRKLKGVRKVILIEEAWKAIMRQGMAEYILYLFKTVRKFFGEAIVVTQDPEDIISSPIVKQAIINNSDCKILLDQSKYQNRFDAIQELLGLTDKDKALVLSMNKANDPTKKYKEVFISLGSSSKVYRTEVSLEEYLTYSTEEKEKMQVQLFAKKYGSMEKGITVLANQIKNDQ